MPLDEWQTLFDTHFVSWQTSGVTSTMVADCFRGIIDSARVFWSLRAADKVEETLFGGRGTGWASRAWAAAAKHFTTELCMPASHRRAGQQRTALVSVSTAVLLLICMRVAGSAQVETKLATARAVLDYLGSEDCCPSFQCPLVLSATMEQVSGELFAKGKLTRGPDLILTAGDAGVSLAPLHAFQGAPANLQRPLHLLKLRFPPGSQHKLADVLCWMANQLSLRALFLQFLHAWALAIDTFFTIIWPLGGIATAPDHHPGERAIGASKRQVATALVRDKVSTRPYKLAKIAAGLGKTICGHNAQADRDEAWRYWMAARRELAGAKHVCIIHDGSNVGHRDRIFAAVMNIATGLAAFAPPQVLRGSLRGCFWGGCRLERRTAGETSYENKTIP